MSPHWDKIAWTAYPRNLTKNLHQTSIHSCLYLLVAMISFTEEGVFSVDRQVERKTVEEKNKTKKKLEH